MAKIFYARRSWSTLLPGAGRPQWQAHASIIRDRFSMAVLRR